MRINYSPFIGFRQRWFDPGKNPCKYHGWKYAIYSPAVLYTVCLCWFTWPYRKTIRHKNRKLTTRSGIHVLPRPNTTKCTKVLALYQTPKAEENQYYELPPHLVTYLTNEVENKQCMVHRQVMSRTKNTRRDVYVHLRTVYVIKGCRK